MIYLDNAATTQIDPEVLDAMLPYLNMQYGNPGSIYKLGREARDAIEHARQQVADFICAKPEQIIFTSGGTEANNMVFKSLEPYLKYHKKTHIIASAVEHDSVIKAIQSMIKHGFDYDFVGVDKFGRVSSREVAERIDNNTGIVSVMHTNNETGTANYVKEIAEICHENGVLFHTDCVQAAGCNLLDVNEIGCDFLSISSHKIHGAKGCGALFVSDRDIISPVICGGADQEFGFRGGTENVAAIVGFGKACEISSRDMLETIAHIRKIKRVFVNRLRTYIHDHHEKLGNRFYLNGDPYEIDCGGKTLNIRIDGVDAESLVLFLDGAKDVCISAGSACRSHESEPSRVLTAMGLTPDEARQSIRVSFSKMNTEEEAGQAAVAICQCVETMIGGINGN